MQFLLCFAALCKNISRYCGCGLSFPHKKKATVILHLLHGNCEISMTQRTRKSSAGPKGWAVFHSFLFLPPSTPLPSLSRSHLDSGLSHLSHKHKSPLLLCSSWDLQQIRGTETRRATGPTDSTTLL